jgi:hypothetical protein
VGTVRKFITNKTFKKFEESGGADDDEADTDAEGIDRATRTALARCGTWLKPKILQWSSDMTWHFKGDTHQPQLAAAKPPHSSFLVSYNHDRRAERALLEF